METCSHLHISGLLAHQWLSHKQSHFVYVFEKADVKWSPYEEAIIIRCVHHCLLMKKMPFIYFHTFKVHAWAEPVFLNWTLLPFKKVLDFLYFYCRFLRFLDLIQVHRSLSDIHSIFLWKFPLNCSLPIHFPSNVFWWAEMFTVDGSPICRFCFSQLLLSVSEETFACIPVTEICLVFSSRRF